MTPAAQTSSPEMTQGVLLWRLPSGFLPVVTEIPRRRRPADCLCTRRIQACRGLLSILQAVARRRLLATQHQVLEQLAVDLGWLLRSHHKNPNLLAAWEENRANEMGPSANCSYSDDAGGALERLPLLREMEVLLRESLEELGRDARIDGRLRQLNQLRGKLFPGTA